MRITLVLLVAMIGAISCSSSKLNFERDAKVFKNENLAFLLSQLYGSDQTIREVNDSKPGVIIMQKIDSLNFVRLIEFIEEHGFPNEKLLGRFYTEYECVCLAAPSILLHNSSRVVQKNTFDLLKQEVQKGNMKSELLALVLDKFYVYNKGYSLYHTQFKKANIKNKEIVNKARLEIGLEALPDSLFTNSNNK